MEEPLTDVRIIGIVLNLLSSAALGVFAGAMLTEGCVLVPYWRSLSASQFFAWYAANDKRLMGFFGPLTAAAALAAFAAAGYALWSGAGGRWFAAVAAAAMLVAVMMFPLYFQAANARFSAASITPDDLPAELARWSTLHRARTIVSLSALVAALFSLGLSL